MSDRDQGDESPTFVDDNNFCPLCDKQFNRSGCRPVEVYFAIPVPVENVFTHNRLSMEVLCVCLDCRYDAEKVAAR